MTRFFFIVSCTNTSPRLTGRFPLAGISRKSLFSDRTDGLVSTSKEPCAFFFCHRGNGPLPSFFSTVASPLTRRPQDDRPTLLFFGAARHFPRSFGNVYDLYSPSSFQGLVDDFFPLRDRVLRTIPSSPRNEARIFSP